MRPNTGCEPEISIRDERKTKMLRNTQPTRTQRTALRCVTNSKGDLFLEYTWKLTSEAVGVFNFNVRLKCVILNNNIRNFITICSDLLHNKK